MGGGGGSSSSTSTSKTETTDARTGAEGGSVAIGQNSTITFTDEFPEDVQNTILQALTEVGEAGAGAFEIARDVIGLSSQAVSSVADTARGAGDAINAVAGRRTIDETGPQLGDLLPFVGVAGALFILYTYIQRKN